MDLNCKAAHSGYNVWFSYHMDPSGTYIRYEAKAIGSGSEGAQQALQEVYFKEMSLTDASRHALTILRQVMEEKLDATNVEVNNILLNNLIEAHMYLIIFFICLDGHNNKRKLCSLQQNPARRFD